MKALAPQHPEWKEKQPFKAALAGDIKTLFAGGEEALIELIVATHSGMTTDEFTQIVKDWLATAKNPKTKRPYTEMVFQPMIELMAYMRANGFKTYIVSGGGVEFMRVFSEQVYGVPPEQVIGSTPTIAELLSRWDTPPLKWVRTTSATETNSSPPSMASTNFTETFITSTLRRSRKTRTTRRSRLSREIRSPRDAPLRRFNFGQPAPPDPRFGPWGKQQCEEPARSLANVWRRSKKTAPGFARFHGQVREKRKAILSLA